MVADGLSINNADFSSTSFRVSQTTIGPHNFLGNYVTYPSQGRTGDNCLLATKVMVPVDGKVREGVGLLGSPSFEIPRSVQRDTNLDTSRARDELRRQLAAKNKHNLAHHGPVPAGAVGQLLYVLTMLAMVVTDIYRLFGARGARGALGRLPAVHDGVHDLRGTRRGGAFGRCARSTARSTIPTSGGTNAIWKFAVSPFDRMLRRHTIQEHHVWRLLRRADRQEGVRRRVRHAREDPRHDRRPLHAQCWRAWSRPLAGGRRLQVRPHHVGVRLHRRESAPSSTTASRWVTAPYSPPIRS